MIAPDGSSIASVVGGASCTATAVGIAATSFCVSYPRGLAINSAGDVFVGDQTNGIYKFSGSTGIVSNYVGELSFSASAFVFL